jgi:5-methylcytosine-specific restriction endonuclease McrA
MRYAENPGYFAEASRRYREANREKVLDGLRAYYVANRESMLARHRRWRSDNPDHARDYARQWRRSNPEKARELVRRSRVLRQSARRAALVPVSLDHLRARFGRFGGVCAYCGSEGRLTVDHVLAVVHGGLDESGNIVPACSSCNSSKNSRPVEEWYRRQPFFTETRWREIQRHCPGAAVGQLPLALLAV